MILIDYNFDGFIMFLEMEERFMIGKKLIQFRKNKGLSQAELAEDVGVTRQTISNWELNEMAPDLKQAQKLSEIFNISLDELVGNEDAILKKLNITENNSNIIIKLIKVLGVTLGTLIFVLMAIVCIYIYTTNYYGTEPISAGEGRVCYFNGVIGDYIVMKNNIDGTISFDLKDKSIIDKLKLNEIKSGEPKEILEKIVTYIKDNGGTCLEDR